MTGPPIPWVPPWKPVRRLPPAIDKPNPTIREVYKLTLEKDGLWRWYSCRHCAARYMWNVKDRGGSSLRHAPADLRRTIRWHAKGHGTEPGPLRATVSF